MKKSYIQPTIQTTTNDSNVLMAGSPLNLEFNDKNEVYGEAESNSRHSSWGNLWD